jgi:hypothetical protein
MRLLKLAGALVGMAIVISATGPALAATANPAFLDNIVTGLKFKGESGKTTVEAVGAEPNLVCTKDTNSGEVTGEKTIKITLDLEGCKEGAFAAQSLGDAKEVVLMSISGELCYINEVAKEVGLYSKLPAEGAHVEVPAIAFLEVFKGAFIGKMEFVNKLQALQDISYKKVNPAECSKKSRTFEVEFNAKKFKGEFESFEELTFEKGIEVMG